MVPATDPRWSLRCRVTLKEDRGNNSVDRDNKVDRGNNNEDRDNNAGRDNGVQASNDRVEVAQLEVAVARVAAEGDAVDSSQFKLTSGNFHPNIK